MANRKERKKIHGCEPYKFAIIKKREGKLAAAAAAAAAAATSGKSISQSYMTTAGWLVGLFSTSIEYISLLIFHANGPQAHIRTLYGYVQ